MYKNIRSLAVFKLQVIAVALG